MNLDFSSILNLVSLKIFRLVTAILLVLGSASPAAMNKTQTNAREASTIEPPLSITSILKNEKPAVGTSVRATSAGNNVISEAVVADLEKKVNDVIAEVEKQLSSGLPVGKFAISDINNDTRKALVNVLCLSNTNKLRSITGSGVLVDPRGVILTNAHIGQYFLLKDYPAADFVNCVIRAGSPARSLYKAKLLYLPSSWIDANPTTLAELDPSGTGEDDYAFLIITEPIDQNAPLPESFPYIQMFIGDGEISVGDATVIAGYAAGFLGGVTIERELYSVSAVAKIREIFTFRDNSLDLISVGGSVVAQRGSSGGAVVNENNNLIAIIVTSTEAQNTADRDLRAITISHINRSLIKNRGSSISALLLGNIASKSEQYNSTEALNLRDILITNMEKVLR